jgi:hypothetical protein
MGYKSRTNWAVGLVLDDARWEEIFGPARDSQTLIANSCDHGNVTAGQIYELCANEVPTKKRRTNGRNHSTRSGHHK